MVRRIAIVAFEPCDTLDVVGPLEVFAFANEVLERAGSRRTRYAPFVVGRTRRLIRSESGLGIMPHSTLRGAALRGVDTLIVAGGAGARAACRSKATLRAVSLAARSCRRVASVCTGAFVLAAAGLLDGRRATTHWAFCEELERVYPGVSVQRDPIFVRDGSVWTSAGVTAGIDLALALVEEDLGREVALGVARWLVVFVRRAGGQSQFSHQLSVQVARREPLRELIAYVEEHPEKAHSVPVLARKVGMSVRNFSRVFLAEVGKTPAAFIEGVRVETARRLLEDSSLPVANVAAASGFGTPDALRRAMARTVDLSPREYRARFGSTHATREQS